MYTYIYTHTYAYCILLFLSKSIYVCICNYVCVGLLVVEVLCVGQRAVPLPSIQKTSTNAPTYGSSFFVGKRAVTIQNKQLHQVVPRIRIGSLLQEDLQQIDRGLRRPTSDVGTVIWNIHVHGICIFFSKVCICTVIHSTDTTRARTSPGTHRKVRQVLATAI